MKNFKPVLCISGLLLLASSCARLAGPDYRRPDTPLKDRWAQEESAPGIIATNWWSGFNDPVLNTLVDAALSGNFDLRAAAGRVERAQALIQSAGSRRLPTLGISAGAEYGVQSSGAGRTASTEAYELGAGVNWEIDIWGKLKKGVAAAEAEYQASGADWRSAYLVLVSETASQYFRLRQLDEQVNLYRRSIIDAKKIRSIYEIRAAENYVSKDTVLRQRAEVRRLEREQQELERERKIIENSLAVLTGGIPGTFSVESRTPDAIGAVQVPAGLPADLLSRRPDILAAEYRVLAAYNLAGKARLDRLPSFALTGSGGSASLSIGSLLSQWTAGLGPVISVPLFDPSRKAEVKVREADLKIASEQYRSTVVKAFQEVEDTLLNLSSRREQLNTAQQAVDDLTKVRDFSRLKFEEGLISQLEVLETERGLLQSEQTALSVRYQLLRDTVTLFKALGGGWPPETTIE
jgi:NodT family efflux transporter outer membrane factor (OMF) lipoprotein